MGGDGGVEEEQSKEKAWDGERSRARMMEKWGAET